MPSFVPVRTDPVALAQRPHPKTGLIHPDAVAFLFNCMGNRRDFFDECVHLLKPNYFTAEEALLKAIYEVMLAIAAQYSGKFTYEAIALTLQDYLRQRQITLDAVRHAEVFAPDASGLLWTMTSTHYGDEHIAFARQKLSELLTERTVVMPMRGLFAARDTGDYPTNIHELLTEYHLQSSRLTSLNSLPRVEIMPARGETPFIAPSETRATGVPWIDARLGGQRAGDANGILGPTGGGKTTLAVHMAVQAARSVWKETLLAGASARPELIVYITVEEEAKKLLPRIWSAMCSIPKARLENMRHWDELSGPNQREDYEAALRTEGGEQDASCERDRYDAARPVVANCLELLDFSGSDDHPNAGCGGVPEIVSALDRLQQVRQQPIRTVILDYAGLTVARSADIGLDDRKLRAGLTRLGDAMKMMVAQRFRCTVWLLHQIAGAFATSSPLKLLHHNMSGESKDFANNLAFCGCIGVVDPATGIRRFNWSKTRNVRGEGIAPVSLQIDEKFAIMRDVTELYSVDETSRRFVPRNEGTRILGIENAPSRPTGTRGAASASAADMQRILAAGNAQE